MRLRTQRAHDRADCRKRRESQSDQAVLTHADEGGSAHALDELQCIDTEGVPIAVVTRERHIPRKVQNRERRGMERSGAPPAPHQHGHCDTDYEWDADRRAHDAHDPESETDEVTTIHRPVVVREQQMRETAEHRTGERDLEREEDVVLARPEEHERQDGKCCDHRADSQPGHGQPEQDDDAQVHQDER